MKGRTLVEQIKNGTTITYSYDSSDMRTSKTVGGVKHNYYYVQGKLMYEDCPSYRLYYAYDANGFLNGIRRINSNGTTENYGIHCNIFGDVISIYYEDGFLAATYTYDSWGKLLAVTDAHGNDMTGVNDIWTQNSIRYRGYVYDEETQLYYLQSRYYDPNTCRFINADDYSVLTASPTALSDKNLFAYCDSNPVVREDTQGAFWETAFDVISLGASIVEVAINPADPLAWAGLVGDTVDLIPFVTGVGEVTRAIKITKQVVDKSDDVVDIAKAVYKTSEATSDIRKATGSYEILYKSGKNYVGKGGFQRALSSARRNAKNGNIVTSIRWKSAPSSKDAFIDEFFMQQRANGVRHPLTYNLLWSPGKNYLGR